MTDDKFAKYIISHIYAGIERMNHCI
jgi:hypothetical protein